MTTGNEVTQSDLDGIVGADDALIAERAAAEQEHRIAEQLQYSLLPDRAFSPDHLEVATYYRAGVAGTRVGGDWFDVIELGAGCTGLVIGDVMGRGVRAAAVMGQMRTAVRSYARLNLSPVDVLEFLDAAVRDLGEDHIVTCVYAIYDPADGTLIWANAGHLPPLVVIPGRPARRLVEGSGPPLGAGPLTMGEDRIIVPPGSILALYTDGLVEHRDRDLDVGIGALAAALAAMTGPIEPDLNHLVDGLVSGDSHDDIAVLLAQVLDEPPQKMAWRGFRSEEVSVGDARDYVTNVLAGWSIDASVVDDVVLATSELMTNAVIHGRPPVELRLRRAPGYLVLYVHDGAALPPRKLRPQPEDELGRGVQLVALLSESWGSRSSKQGKSVWCTFRLRA